MRRLRKVRAGLYEIVGVKCGGDKIFGPCGGAIFTERNGRGQFTWETYCEKCKTCDFNGHRTLAMVLHHLDYWKGPQ